MNVNIRVFIASNENNKFFGQGPFLLLQEIEKTGSLRQASINMKMAYSKALKIVKTAEKELCCCLVKKTTGGIGGGGSVLTEEAKDVMHKFELLKEDISRYSHERFNEIF